MTECEALGIILGECPGLSFGADGVDVFAELINAMNLAYFMQKA
jgi:hypothetical protein